MRDSAGFAPASLLIRRPGICARRGEDSSCAYWLAVLGAILTIGNEVVSRRRPEHERGVARPAARVARRPHRADRGGAGRDRRDRRVRPARARRGSTTCVVTGGLGGTPDDITREALAAAFDVKQEEVPELAADLRARFPTPSRLRGALGAAARRQPPAHEPARRRARLRDRERLGAAGPAVRDGGDVRPLRRGAPRRAADLVVAARLPDARERDRPAARRGDGALAAGARSARTRASSPDGPEVEIVLKSADPKRARRRRRLARAGLEPRPAASA